MRGGEDAWLVQRRDRVPPEPGHKLIPVYVEMLLQVCRDYPGLPDPRTLTTTEIRFFYAGLRSELKKSTGGKGPPPASAPKRGRSKKTPRRK